MKSFCNASRSFNRNVECHVGPDHISFMSTPGVFAVFFFHTELLLFSDFLSNCSVDFQYPTNLPLIQANTYTQIAGVD